MFPKAWNQKEHSDPDFVPECAAAAAKSLQSCLTLCDPIDTSPPGSAIPGILQARTLELVAIPFSNAWKWKVKVKSLRWVRLLETPWTVAHQAPLSMGLSRQEYWSLLSFLLPGASSWPRDWTCISSVPFIGRQILYHQVTWETLQRSNRQLQNWMTFNLFLPYPKINHFPRSFNNEGKVKSSSLTSS